MKKKLTLFFCVAILYACGPAEEPTKESRSSQARTESRDVPAESPREPEEIKLPSAFSLLSIESVTYENGKVVIVGKTDLPDNAKIHVDLDVAGGAPEDTYIGVSTNVYAYQRKFTARLKPPNRPEFRKGPYEIEIMLTPRAQTPSILAAIGKDGENLVGDLVRDAYSFKVMENSKTVNLNLQIETLPELPPTSTYPSGTPERTFVEMLHAWKSENWNQMARLTQLSWRQRTADPAGMLESQFSFKTLLGAEKISSSKSGLNMTIVSAIVHIAIGADIQKKLISANIIREQGQWGFNPISTMRLEDR